MQQLKLEPGSAIPGHLPIEKTGIVTEFGKGYVHVGHSVTLIVLTFELNVMCQICLLDRQLPKKTLKHTVYLTIQR